MHQNALLDGVLLDQPNTLRRLLDEFVEAARELRDDPVGYVSAIRSRAAGSSQPATLLRFGFSLAILCYSLAFATALLLWTTSRRSPAANSDELTVKWIKAPPIILPALDLGSFEDDAGGGGGGGRQYTVAAFARRLRAIPAQSSDRGSGGRAATETSDASISRNRFC
jgi:hypothetical protein